MFDTIKITLGIKEPTLPENEPTKLPDYFPDRACKIVKFHFV